VHNPVNGQPLLLPKLGQTLMTLAETSEITAAINITNIVTYKVRDVIFPRLSLTVILSYIIST
jgi:hypothetical protein